MSRAEACRACRGRPLDVILELGELPLANRLLSRGELAAPEPRLPLTLAFCPACALVQILETVDPQVLFGDYVYFSSFSDSLVAHARDEADMLVRRFSLGEKSLVVEIASNDGYLLRNFVERGIPSLGIEPAANIAEVAEERGVRTLCEFFGADLAERLARDGTRADVVIGNNVLAHVADLNGFVGGVSTILAERGCAVFEFPYVGDMIDNTEFDTIYHEHLCYYSLHAVRALFERHGLSVIDVERLEIHGGSLRLFAAPSEQAPPPAAAVGELAAREEARGLTSAGFYREFASKVEALKATLLEEIGRRKRAGQRIAAYGASAKGSTLLNYFGIGAESLDFIVDRSTVKQGKLAPGNHLPILAPAALAERRPDAVLLLTWNFADEILRQQEAYLAAGGEFIVPIPRVRSVGRKRAES